MKVFCYLRNYKPDLQSLWLFDIERNLRASNGLSPMPISEVAVEFKIQEKLPRGKTPNCRRKLSPKKQLLNVLDQELNLWAGLRMFTVIAQQDIIFLKSNCDVFPTPHLLQRRVFIIDILHPSKLGIVRIKIEVKYL